MTQGTVWTPEMKSMLMDLVNDPKNIGYTEIAKHMAKCFDATFTKNSCIGMARRLRLGPRPVKMKRKTTVDFSPIAPKIEPRKQGFALTIYQLREGDCKFVLEGTAAYPPYTYCGHPAVLGRSWCKVHIKRVFSPTYGSAKTTHPGL